MRSTRGVGQISPPSPQGGACKDVVGLGRRARNCSKVGSRINPGRSNPAPLHQSAPMARVIVPILALRSRFGHHCSDDRPSLSASGRFSRPPCSTFDADSPELALRTRLKLVASGPDSISTRTPRHVLTPLGTALVLRWCNAGAKLALHLTELALRCDFRVRRRSWQIT